MATGFSLIHEPDDNNLFILRVAIVEALVSGSEHAEDLGQFILATQEAEMPRFEMLGRLAWVADLSPESFREFQHAYLRTFAESVLKREWGRLETFLARWREAAEVEGDPDLLAEILAEGDPLEHVDLDRPAGKSTSARTG